MVPRLVPLSDIEVEAGHFIVGEFRARHMGRPVWITAVLDRTAVGVPGEGEPKRLYRKADLLVDPSILTIRVHEYNHQAHVARLRGQARQRMEREAGLEE